MQEELTLYITTCDPNIFIIKYFQYFFNKYWNSSMKVKILGFNQPDFELNDNFEFVSLGPEQVNGAKGWSNYIIDYFQQINENYFIFGIDDFMIARPVDVEVYETAKHLIDTKIGRIDLQCSMQYARNPKHTKHYITKNGIQFLQLNQSGYGENLYQNSGAFSIWNKKYFLKNMKRDWSPWDWELKGSKLAEFDGFKVVGSSDRWAIKKLELLSNNGWPNVINTTGLRAFDIAEMEKLRDPKDRVTQFVNVQDKRWGYEQYCGEKWLEIIYGD